MNLKPCLTMCVSNFTLRFYPLYNRGPLDRIVPLVQVYKQANCANEIFSEKRTMIHNKKGKRGRIRMSFDERMTYSLGHFVDFMSLHPKALMLAGHIQSVIISNNLIGSKTTDLLNGVATLNLTLRTSVASHQNKDHSSAEEEFLTGFTMEDFNWVLI